VAVAVVVLACQWHNQIREAKYDQLAKKILRKIGKRCIQELGYKLVQVLEREKDWQGQEQGHGQGQGQGQEQEQEQEQEQGKRRMPLVEYANKILISYSYNYMIIKK
jgi:hypothetical protein